PYSQVIALNGFIYCSKQIPIKADGTIILQSLTNIQLVFTAFRSSIEKTFKGKEY
ncbi:hypothetical protein V1509DRAFT_554279, partial [Lipomyces kononenkoae]